MAERARTGKVKVGLLGCGSIVGAHQPGFRAAADTCQVVMVAEPRRERHPQIREWFGADVAIVDDFRDVLANPEVVGVDIVLPHNLHMTATVAAAQAGKHVLVEKVMARNVWECDRMIDACRDAGVTLTVAHDRRYHGDWTALKTVIDTGWLGKVFFWKLDHNQNVLPPAGHWIRTWDGIGGGAVMSCLTHQIDALRWYGGEVDSVTCMTNTLPERMEGEFLGLIGARMRSGALAELSINWWTSSNTGANALWYELVQVCGTGGEAYYMSGRGTFVRIHDRSNRDAAARFGDRVFDEFVPVPHDSITGHEKCIVEWVRLLRGEPADIRTSGEVCRGTVEVAEAAYAAQREGRTVHLPITPQPWVNRSDPQRIALQSQGATPAQADSNPDNPLVNRKNT